MVEEAREEEEGIKRGPKGGKKHRPGRDHDSKSHGPKKNRFRERMRKRNIARTKEARRLWAEYDRLSEEQQKLLGTKGMPKLPRPKDED